MRVKWQHTQNSPSLQFSRNSKNPSFKNTHDGGSHYTTAVYHLRPPHSLSSESAVAPWIVVGDFLHPLTFKLHRYNRPINFSLSNFRKSTLAVFYRSSSDFDKILIIPKPKSINERSNDYVNALLVLYGGGKLTGRLPGEESSWVDFSGGVNAGKFDDLKLFKGKIYALDRQGRVYKLNNIAKSRKLNLGKTLVSEPISPGPNRFGWRKRFVVDGNEVYLVVRLEEKFFRVYKLIRKEKSANWGEIRVFDGGKVLFMARDCYFFTRAKVEFPGREYKNSIVFSEAAFPQYGNNCWEFTQSVRQLGFVRKCEDDIAVFRLSDGVFAREGENSGFPKISWSPPSWVFQVSSRSAVECQSRSISYSSHSESESDEDEDLDSNRRAEKDGVVPSDIIDLTSEDEQDGDMQTDLIGRDQEQEDMGSDPESQDQADKVMQCDSDSQENDDEQINSDDNIEGRASSEEDLSPSLSGPESESTDPMTDSLSADDEEVTRTLVSINETSRKSIIQSVPKACTSSITESHESESAIAKFEGLDLRSDLVPTLETIWRNHGNIIENSSMRSGDIVASALESLATMVQILDENSAESLSDCQADYLSSTLSDLQCIRFNVSWLIPYIEKAVKQHKSKPLLDSVNNLSQLISQVKERKAILLDKVAILREEENKLTGVMAKVSKMIPFSGVVKFDEPVGSGLT
ncbi:hypothetical protein RND81_14G171600 [Saponaria officinalis]|uniref:KIB1-4 beta-propeller domain-containing protein n=1 Tax=Saponaria officinalis TaxID=3572 RepID=A0AAW1GTS3_SAPOF